jgi:MFS family permease
LINDFDISYSESSWILTAYLISGAIMTPINGKLSDIYGKKKILLVIMIVYIVGVSIGGFTTNFFSMIFVRILQGVGISMFPIAFGMIREQFPISKISIGQGIITSMFSGGAVIGLVVGGHIIQEHGWHATFFTIAPVSLVLFFILKKFVHKGDPHSSWEISHEEKTVQSKIDVFGAVTLALSIASLLLALTFAEEINPNSVVGFGLLGIISMLLFIMIEKRVKSPLIDFKILKNRTFLLANMTIVLVSISMFVVFQTIPVLVRSPEPVGFGQDPVSTTYVQLPFAIVLLIFGPASGIITSKLGSIKPIIGGSIIIAIAFLSLFINHSSSLIVAVDLAIVAIGISLTNVGAMNIILISLPRKDSGISLGITSLMRIMGASLGPVMAAMFMQINQIKVNGLEGMFPSQVSYDLIFLSSALLAILSIILSVFLKRSASGLLTKYL